MEWVRITGKTEVEARAQALDVLGVHEDEAEIQLLQPAKKGLLGLGKKEALVRARVKPRKPPAKDDRRDRKRRQGRKGESRGGSDRNERNDRNNSNDEKVEAAPVKSRNRRPAKESAAASTNAASNNKPSQEDEMRSDLTLAEQAKVAVNFVDGLVKAFGLSAAVQAKVIEADSQIEVTVDGADLGLLVGQQAVALDAIQELTRTVVLRSANDAAHLHVDVAGYRLKRREALARFAAKVAEQVKETGEEVALEPMSPADRKAIHDAVTELGGLSTRSEGVDASRHVVVSLAASE